MEALPSLMYGRCSAFRLYNVFISNYILRDLRFTINDVAKHENSSKMFGGKKSKK
jgi:hypothetical protein